MSETEKKPPLVLPTQKMPAVSKSPKNMILFSKPKVGKTSMMAALNNALILDLEDGSDYVEALKIKARTVEQIKEIGEAIIANNRPYDYIVVDTITALEEICVPYAEIIYSRTSMGKNWFTKLKPEYGSILNLPNGAGYPYLREAFTKIIEYIKTWAPRIILVGHVKDVALDKAGTEANSMDLDLTGKLKRISSANSDAIGYLYRKGNQNILSFKTTDEVSCGARPEHLRNQEIVISEMTENGLVTHWEKVYID